MILLLRVLVLFAITRLATRNTPMTELDITANHDNDSIGDLPSTEQFDHPVLAEQPDNLDRVTVYINATYARQLNGAHAIRIRSSDGTYMDITATQADELVRDLTAIVPFVAGIRADIGANS